MPLNEPNDILLRLYLTKENWLMMCLLLLFKRRRWCNDGLASMSKNKKKIEKQLGFLSSVTTWRKPICIILIRLLEAKIIKDITCFYREFEEATTFRGCWLYRYCQLTAFALCCKPIRLYRCDLAIVVFGSKALFDASFFGFFNLNRPKQAVVLALKNKCTAIWRHLIIAITWFLNLTSPFHGLPFAIFFCTRRQEKRND